MLKFYYNSTLGVNLKKIFLVLIFINLFANNVFAVVSGTVEKHKMLNLNDCINTALKNSPIINVYIVNEAQHNKKKNINRTNYVVNYWSNVIGVLFTAILLSVSIGFSLAFTENVRALNAIEENKFFYYFFMVFPVFPFFFLVFYITKFITNIRRKEKLDKEEEEEEDNNGE